MTARLALMRIPVAAAVAVAASALFAEKYPLLDADLPQGRVAVAFETDAPALSLDRDLTATLTVEAPEGVSVALPSIDALRARFQGFSAAEGFERGAAAPGAGPRAIRWRLRADPAAPRYRLAPFAVRLSVGAESQGLVSSAYLFPLSPPPEAQGGIEVEPRRFFVWPGPRAILRWTALAAAALLALAALRLAARRIRRAVRVRLMSPSERALYELDRLLGGDLVARGLFKDFYVELTHVVRRYIERAYGIRAPRLTTEEFLASAGGDPRFARDSIESLSGFLRSADMVKFAGLEATVEMASGAASSAREYIVSDSARRREAATAAQGPAAPSAAAGKEVAP